MEELTEGSAEEAAEKTVEESVEEPAEESAEETVEESVEEPAEGSAEEAVEESVEEPAEGSAEEAVEESIEEPAEGSAEEAVEESTEEPAEGSAGESAEEPADESTGELTSEFPAFDASGETSSGVVKVSAGPGVFPAGAMLVVSDPAPARRLMKAAAPQAVQGETVVASYAYEITVTDAEGSPIQPAGGATATVAFQLDEADDLNLSVRVLHETADGSEELPAYAADGAVIAEPTGFSKYTVEFYYNQKEYVLQGDSSIALSEILAAVGLTGEVTDVAVSNTDLFSASNETGEWIITAHQAFDTTEWIAVTINGVAYDITVTDSQESVSVSYVEHKWNGSAVESETKTADAAPVPSDGNMTSGWYYLNSNVTKSGRIETITGDVNLILGDGFTLDVKGLYVPVGSTLTIYGQNPDPSLDNGKIYSHPSGGAAIGGYSGHDNGNIVIHGGNIVANGYDHCAGIGSNDGRTGGSITIYGGTVTAKGGSDGAGIGGGRNCNGGDITIYGGEITANGPTDSE